VRSAVILTLSSKIKQGRGKKGEREEGSTAATAKYGGKKKIRGSPSIRSSLENGQEREKKKAGRSWARQKGEVDIHAGVLLFNTHLRNSGGGKKKEEVLYLTAGFRRKREKNDPIFQGPATYPSFARRTEGKDRKKGEGKSRVL